LNDLVLDQEKFNPVTEECKKILSNSKKKKNKTKQNSDLTSLTNKKKN
jgi:hypothetical protein